MMVMMMMMMAIVHTSMPMYGDCFVDDQCVYCFGVADFIVMVSNKCVCRTIFAIKEFCVGLAQCLIR